MRRRELYWYGGDLYTWEELCCETYRDTGYTPDMGYANKYWRATRLQVLRYRFMNFLNRMKIWERYTTGSKSNYK